MGIVEFLEARIAEDEAAARAAIDPERPGTHWQWVTTETDTVVAPGDTAEALDYQAVSLRSVEEFQAKHNKFKLPAFIIHSVNEMLEGAGEHIVRWDPSRVLAECAAKRKMLSKIPRQSDVYDGLGGTSAYVLQCLAWAYMDHPEYQAEWAL